MKGSKFKQKLKFEHMTILEISLPLVNTQYLTWKHFFPNHERFSLDLVALSRCARAVFVAEKPYVPPLSDVHRSFLPEQ